MASAMFDATVDFEVTGALEQALNEALASMPKVGTVYAVHIPADSEEGEILCDDTEPSREVGEDDWYVIGRSVEELSAALRALL